MKDFIFSFCLKERIDFIEFSTVGVGWSKIMKYSKDEFSAEPFAKKKEKN
ncbi:MAG: hypothetical protein ACRCX2_09700 [Paraclostridium sp.]